MKCVTQMAILKFTLKIQFTQFTLNYDQMSQEQQQLDKN